MKTTAKRTLVKSAPELWELADDSERMQAWMAGLAGSSAPVPVEVVERDGERALAWRSLAGGSLIRIAIELSESGFGTTVRITAEHDAGDDASVARALENLLDDLGSPERRPFAAA